MLSRGQLLVSDLVHIEQAQKTWHPDTNLHSTLHFQQGQLYTLTLQALSSLFPSPSSTSSTTTTTTSSASSSSITTPPPTSSSSLLWSSHADQVNPQWLWAIYWWQRAAQLESGTAYLRLAWCYRHGRFFPQDDRLTVLYLARAAVLGDRRAALRLGRVYELGEYGQAVDYVKAISWYEKAGPLPQEVLDRLPKLRRRRSLQALVSPPDPQAGVPLTDMNNPKKTRLSHNAGCSMM
eukprot:TRINITY_DN13106_c0_g3_i1.p1 TRINITY_DN13106_c0_g3~~TRINITY_DN13106_c0_g3_i1.p1  ORF type:complete len:236 (+),score=50.90 TRINITY_DN13106_c0_g3_i1:108-815(+)